MGDGLKYSMAQSAALGNTGIGAEQITPKS